MRTRQKLLVATALMLCVSTAQAQTTRLLVHSDEGDPQSFALSDINKITFSAGKMNIEPASGTSSEIALSTISHLAFSVGETTEISPLEPSKFGIYPNPVRDELLVTSDTEIETIAVFGLTGNVLLRQNVQSSTVNLSLGFLPTGIYLIQVKRADAISTQKIIKL
ncbi:hypothetical protein AGMMS49965_21940 [Bacteroidia bacterium]|nr:hypothetical protein AGMMS49965_21940 [Bacteroidia bacterium]